MSYLTPAQVNDSQSSWPVYTFRVNLPTLAPTAALPNRTTLDGNETTTEAENQVSARTIFLPGLIGNVEGIGPKGFLYHGDTFTVKGQKATYLKNTYVLGTTEDVLQIVE